MFIPPCISVGVRRQAYIIIMGSKSIYFHIKYLVSSRSSCVMNITF